MAEALKVNSTLTSLGVYGNNLGERGGVAMAEALPPVGIRLVVPGGPESETVAKRYLTPTGN